MIRVLALSAVGVFGMFFGSMAADMMTNGRYSKYFEPIVYVSATVLFLASLSAMSWVVWKVTS